MVTNIMKAMAPGEGAHGELAAFFAARPDVTLAQFGQYTTLAESTMRHFWNGELGSSEVKAEVRRVLDLARAGEILQPGGGRSATALVVTESARRARRVARAGNFYKTQTVAKISEVLNYCAEECEIGVVTADYGCGKTEAVAAWRRATAGAIESMVFEFDEFSSSNKVDFLARLAGQFGLACAKGPQNGGRIFQALVEYLRENPCLLIFDQCEMVRGRSPVFGFSADNVVVLPTLDRMPVINEAVWQYDDQDGTAESDVTYLEATSITTFGRGNQFSVQSKGLRTELGAAWFTQWTSRRLFARFAGTPAGLLGGAPVVDVEAMLLTMPVWVGDYVTLSHPKMPDVMTGALGVTNRVYEVIDRSPDYVRGRMRYKLLDTGLTGMGAAPVYGTAVIGTALVY